jgi:hypothetical protein
VLSFSTKRFLGFSPEQLDGLEWLVPADCFCSQVYRDCRLASDVLETYLGRTSCKKVLAGQIVLGEGEQNDEGNFYSDLRASLTLSQSLDIQIYLDTVNVNSNTSRDVQGLPALEFSVALHVGKVIYGCIFWMWLINDSVSS